MSCASYNSDLVDDPLFSTVCNKLGHPINGVCPTNYMQWQSGMCFINCPAPLLENGISCLKKTLERSIVQPHCASSFFWFNGYECVFNPFSLLLLVLFAALLVWYLKSFEKVVPLTDVIEGGLAKHDGEHELVHYELQNELQNNIEM